MENVSFSPSLMCMPLLKTEQQIRFLDGKCDSYHVDIMDGHFVPNITLSPTYVKEVSELSSLPFDCHLMVTNPQDYVDELVANGAAMITVHIESINGVAYRLFNRLDSLGVKKGLAINPETSVQELYQLLPHVDKVTVMAVDPGFRGQPFIPDVLDKIKDLATYRSLKDLTFQIEVDGSCNTETFKRYKEAGVDVFVLGSALFNQDEIETAWEKMAVDFENCLA